MATVPCSRHNDLKKAYEKLLTDFRELQRNYEKTSEEWAAALAREIDRAKQLDFHITTLTAEQSKLSNCEREWRIKVSKMEEELFQKKMLIERLYVQANHYRKALQSLLNAASPENGAPPKG